MSKETVYATRDIKKGEPLSKVIGREYGYFYFLSRDGDVLRAPFATKRLSPHERALREQAKREAAEAVLERRAQRLQKKMEKARVLAQAKAAKKAERVAKLNAKIAALEQLKHRY